jgi:CRP-like cAMP-binding protein
MSPKTAPPEFRNWILAGLSAGDRKLLLPDLEAVQLDLRQSLEVANQPISHVYFPADGLASIVARDPSDRQGEVGVVGCEGMTGIPVLLGNSQSPHESYMQIAGTGHRLSVSALRTALAKSASLRTLMSRYVHALTIQMSHTALANAKVKVNERLARWLLMADDRVSGDVIKLTHEFLALMLGVRRQGVTDALQELEGKGLIRASRGKISILDRPGLESASDGCYGAPEAEYRRLMAEPT